MTSRSTLNSPLVLLSLCLSMLLAHSQDAGAQNMIQPDPDFDGAILPWQLTVDGGAVDHQAADGFPAAGSLEAISAAAAPAEFDICQQALVDPITFAAPGTYLLSGYVKSVGELGISTPQVTLSVYSSHVSEVATCLEEDLVATKTFDLPSSPDAWTAFQTTLDSAEFVHDYRLQFTMSHGLTGPTTTRLDTLALVPAAIFSDGFESGTTDSWSP